MSDNSTIFSGTSRYANDFQQIINRSVAIASLPMTQLEAQKTTLSDQSSALGALDSKFAVLQSSLQGLASASGSSWSTSISDASVVKADLTDGALAGVYSVQVAGLGSYTSAMSKDLLQTVADPAAENISPAADYTLTVDGVERTITPASNTLSDLADAINRADAGVQATIVNIGPASAPDYRLSIRSAKLGPVEVQLTAQLEAGNQDLLDTPSPGTLATYRVNGQPADAISSDSRTVTVAPGVTVTLLKAGSADIAVGHSTQGIGSALSSFVAAYNAAVDELDKHRGENDGALRGNSVVYTLAQSLRDISAYSDGQGALSSLTSLGLGFDNQGKLSLDITAFTDAAGSDFDKLAAFLGSASTGGFLKAATDSLDGLENSTSGIIKTALSGYQTQIAQQDTLIAGEQGRVDQLQQSLETQMSAADALIASLEQQANYITGLFQAISTSQKSLR